MARRYPCRIRGSKAKGPIHILKKEPATAIFLFLGLFFLASQVFPLPLMLLGRFIDFWAVTVGVAQGAALDVPILMAIAIIGGITNIAWMRSMAHSLMDSFVLFFLSFFICIPVIFIGMHFGFLFALLFGLETSDLGPILVAAWMGTFFTMTSLWRLFVFERFNRLARDIHHRNKVPGAAFIDMIKILLEKKPNKDQVMPGSNQEDCRPVGGSEQWDIKRKKTA